MALEQLTVNCTNTEQGSNHKYGVAPVSHHSALQRCACTMPGSSTKPIDSAFQGDYSARDTSGFTPCTYRQSLRNGDTKPLSALGELTTVSPYAQEQTMSAFLC